MKIDYAVIVTLAVMVAVPCQAQRTLIIDLNAKPEPFSAADYDELLDCTVSKHPDGTRRYAEYHLLRRNNQTPEQNKADADSALVMPIIGDCYEFKKGKPIPFSLDRLIGDWGTKHDVYARNAAPGPMKVKNSGELAVCAMTHHSALVDEMLELPKPQGVLRYLDRFIGPQCQPAGANVKLDIDEFYAAIDARKAVK